MVRKKQSKYNCKKEIFNDIEILTKDMRKIDKLSNSNLNEKLNIFKRIWNKLKLFDDWLDRHKKETRLLKVAFIIGRLSVSGAGIWTIFEILFDLIL